MEDSFHSAAFMPTGLSSDNLKGLATAMEFYFADVKQQVPAVLQRYEQVIPKVDRAIRRA